MGSLQTPSCRGDPRLSALSMLRLIAKHDINSLREVQNSSWLYIFARDQAVLSDCRPIQLRLLTAAHPQVEPILEQLCQAEDASCAFIGAQLVELLHKDDLAAAAPEDV